MLQLRFAGLILFLAGLVAFTLSLATGSFTLTYSIFEKVVENEAHRQALLPALQGMIDKTYTSNIAFVNDFKHAFQQTNASFEAQQAWDKVIYADYTLALTKACSEGIVVGQRGLVFFLSVGLAIIGALFYMIPQIKLLGPAGIKNNHIFHRAATSRGWIGILVGTYLIAFYVLLYFFPAYMSNWILLFDPISHFLNGGPASHWFVYGCLYCLSMIVMGVRMFIKYRHSNYQTVRTASVLFFQIGFAFLIPEMMAKLNMPAVDLKNMWPLDYSFFFDYRLDKLAGAGNLGMFLLVWGILLFTVGVPVMVYFFGKRWYCSWVCGCGGLAETVGDPYRQLSDKSVGAWKIERWLIHAVLAFAIVMTVAVLYTYFTGNSQFFGFDTFAIRKTYGFSIGAIFSGVVGTGFYPMMGNRVWCRFGCPLAAYLGLVQRFRSKFRITTNGGQCISCGNCSTYCEMGIDVRWYAQRGQSIVRSSCVGCGVCSSVCPRGVLNLENADGTSMEDRASAPAIIIGREGALLNI